MKRILTMLCAALLLLGLSGITRALAQSVPPNQPVQIEDSGDSLFSPDELDDLLAPIALYPDPLLAQILPAATFIDQIGDAAADVREYGVGAWIGSQPWDVSVKAIAHYPDVLNMMADDYDWTASLGQAFVEQQDDVMESIQRLRADAMDMGNLNSTPQQQIIIQDGLISIVPVQPLLIFVPRYDPYVVYVQRPAPLYSFISFGIGLRIGAWLNRDCDWQRQRVYYHGWKGSGWIGRARPHIRDRRGIYINSRYRTLHIDRDVLRHDIQPYRTVIRREILERRETPGRPVLRSIEPRRIPSRRTFPGTPSRPATPQPRRVQPALPTRVSPMSAPFRSVPQVRPEPERGKPEGVRRRQGQPAARPAAPAVAPRSQQRPERPEERQIERQPATRPEVRERPQTEQRQERGEDRREEPGERRQDR